MQGKNTNESKPSPSTNKILANGQCIILNNTPSKDKEPEIDPEINVNFFIILCI
jgi:hypothetical protein